MNLNDFDQQLRKKIDEEELVVNPLQWEKLENALPKEKTRKVLYFRIAGVAASVAILLMGFWLYVQFNNKLINTVANTETKEQPSSKTNPNNTATKESQSPQKIKLPISSEHSVATKQQQATQKNKTLYQQNKSNFPISTQHEPIFKNKQDEGYGFNANLSPSQESIEVPQESNTTKSLANSNTTATNKQIASSPIIDIDNEHGDKHHLINKNTSINIAGGVNYGSLNLGYMAAISAKQHLGEKFYIEGSLGFLQNQEVVTSTMSTNQYSQILNNSNRGRPAKLTESPSGIYYLQFAPAIGYEILKDMSLGVGADIQRTLDGTIENRTIIATENGFKMMPIWDAGVTTRAEVALSKQIKAGLLYREGLNNLLSGTQNYYNRRFVQVQLKLKLYGR